MRYESPGGRTRTRLIVALATGALIGVAGLLLLGQTEPSPRTAPPPATVVGGSGTVPIATAPGADPIVAATTWLAAYRTVRYTDPTPTTWAQRVAPLLTEPARSQIAQQAAVGVAGASWERFTAGRCNTRVAELAAVIPPEAPRTTTTVYVQVTGVVVTSCDAGSVGDQPDEAIAATLELRQEPGRAIWQVARRLF